MTLELPAVWLINYALLLTRCLGLAVFLPVPGVQTALPMTKVALGVALAAALAPLAVAGPGAEALASPAAPWEMLRWMASEAALGFGMGCSMRVALEAFGLAAQALGFQAGFSYVNMVDPTSQVDASILNVAFALLANLLFFAFDLHLFLIRAMARSAEIWPLGSYAPPEGAAEAMVRLGGVMFDVGVRLSLPVIAALLLIDLTLGLLNQVNPRMQLLTLAFPIKIVAGLVVLIPMLGSATRVFRYLAEQAGEVVTGLLAR
ncbi:MAG: flagellar biosynthetic protein FliR [Acidobacteria bacterium]|nr:flagellar biosynthetic protein FliR [Acidobacteriota bacterium]